MRLKSLLGPLPDAGASVFFTTLFFLFFIVLCWYVWQKERKSIYEHLEKLPLEDN